MGVCTLKWCLFVVLCSCCLATVEKKKKGGQNECIVVPICRIKTKTEGGKIMERNWRDQRGNCESLKTKLNNLLSCCFCSEKDKSGRTRRMSK